MGYSNQHYIDGYNYKFYDAQQLEQDYKNGVLEQVFKGYEVLRNADYFDRGKSKNDAKNLVYDARIKKNVQAQAIIERVFRFQLTKQETTAYNGSHYSFFVDNPLDEKSAKIQSRNNYAENNSVSYHNRPIGTKYISKASRNVLDFMKLISANIDINAMSYDAETGCCDAKCYNFTNSFKQIVSISHNGIIDSVGSYCQNSQKAKERHLLTLDAVLSTNFNAYTNFYCTKNSFAGNRHRSEGLFSFDNIVIDVDNHSDAEHLELDGEQFKSIQHNINKLISKLNKEVEKGDFLSFNAVKTGRGVHLWIHLISFSATSYKMQKLYDNIVKYLSDKVKQVIADNNIDLSVDDFPTKNQSGLYRLPDTKNMKVYKKSKKGGNTYFKAKLIKQTEKHHSLQELCKFCGFKRKTTPETAPLTYKYCNTKLNITATDTQYIPLLKKRQKFIQLLVTDCNKGNCHGRRNNIIYYYYLTVVRLYDTNTAHILTYQLNEQFNSPLSKTDVNTKMKWVDKMLENGNNRIFKIANEKLFAQLALTQEEINLYNTCSQSYVSRQKTKQEKAERIRKIKELSEQGLTKQQIIAQTNYSKHSVNKYAETKVIDYNQIKELYMQGITQKEIASKCNCSESTVSEYLKAYKPSKEERTKAIMQMSDAGLTHKQIADKLKISTKTVQRTLTPP